MNSKNYQEAQTRANYCRLFSNPYRVLIVWALHRKELSVSELAEEIQATLQNTSQHLRVMKHCGLVEARREGQIGKDLCAPNNTLTNFGCST